MKSWFDDFWKNTDTPKNLRNLQGDFESDCQKVGN
jgi:hypothetical protein